jgi:hypothetical protein
MPAEATNTALPATETVVVIDTSVPIPPPDVQATADAAGTQVARDYVALRTAVALTPHPTVRGGPPLETPEPVPTLALGLFEYHGTLTNDQTATHYTSYWTGIVNGDLLSVWAGRVGCPPSDCPSPYEGVLQVIKYDANQKMISRDSYGTPRQVGELTIIAVNNTQVTLTSDNPTETLVFDLATRQWVFVPTPIPFPSNRPTPLP